MKHLVVTECFGSIPISDSGSRHTLTSREADELLAYVAKYKLDQDGIVVSRHTVTFINYVGYIRLRTCAIEILPKVSGDNPAHSRRVLLRMLQRTGYLDIHESQISRLTQEKLDLFEILAYLFTVKLSNELRKGVYQSYRLNRDELQLVRGKIDINRQIAREAAKRTGVSCVYDEFQADNQLNRILKVALQLIIICCRYADTRKRAAHCSAFLDEVQKVSVTREMMDNVIFDRINRRYEESFNLARLLISKEAPISEQGEKRNSSILFKMNDLFESYIAYMARKISTRVTVKDRTFKLLVNESSGKGTFQLEPDLLVENRSGQQLIVDTKWKMIRSTWTRHGVKRHDYYQMYAYLTRYQAAGTVVLLYPHHSEIHLESGACLESWHLEEQPAKRLQVYSIDYEDEEKTERELSEIIKKTLNNAGSMKVEVTL